MTSITFLGQGAMDSRMADRLEAAGHDVTRWNRSGATQTPCKAVADADIVIAMLRDDEASRSVWLDGETGALAGVDPGAIAIESSTISRDHAQALGEAVVAAGVHFLDAPVLGSRPQAEAGQLIHLIGGDEGDITQVQPVLAAIGTKQLHAGPVGAGASLKLIANTLFGIQVVAMAKLIGRMKDLGLDPATAIGQLSETPLLSPAAQGAVGLMLSGKDDPMFPVELVAKDFGYAIDGQPQAMPLASAALNVFETAAAKGLADENLTAVRKIYQ